jgi:hypothetical protein
MLHLQHITLVLAPSIPETSTNMLCILHGVGLGVLLIYAAVVFWDYDCSAVTSRA